MGRDVVIPVKEARFTHIQFRRFSGCPICNTHIGSMISNKQRLDEAGIREVLFFHSSQQEVASFHQDLPFDAIGDKEKRFYRQFGVESSLFYLSLAALAAGLQSISRGKIGIQPTGGVLGLPAEFLIAPDGSIKAAHYGKHAYDQWTVDKVLSLAGSD